MSVRPLGRASVRTTLLGATMGLYATGLSLMSPAAFAAAPASQPSAAFSAAPAAPSASSAPFASPAPSGSPPLSGSAATSGMPVSGGPPTAGAKPTADDIRDIRGPRPIDSPWVLWALVGAGALAVLLAYGLWKWIRGRRNVPEIPDFEVALRRLDAARELMRPGGAREFSIEVSAVVREFIERRFRVMAAHRTTHEFLHDIVLSSGSALASHRDLLGDFLQSCDLAKFGGWNLDLGQMNTMLESARRFIQSAAASPGGASVSSSDGPPTGSFSGGAPAPTYEVASASETVAPAGPSTRIAPGKSHVSLPST